MAGKTGKRFAPPGDKLINLRNSIDDEPEMMFNNMEHAEQEIIDFILNSVLFVIEEMKYQPIIAYLITRKELTQTELQNLTGLSSGLISEGLN